MLKRIIFAAILAVGTILPATAASVNNLTISNVYIGSYGLAQGRAYISCTNGQLYLVNLGTDWGRGAMTAALTAQSTGRTINVVTTTQNGTITNEWFIDRIVTNPQ